MERRAKTHSERGDEIVGVAVTAFDYEGTLPDRTDLVLPSGARLSVGRDR